MGILFDLLAAPFAMAKLKGAREILGELTPLKTDCGRLCEGACCQPDESGDNGMLLLPFEEKFYHKPIDGFTYKLVEDERLYRGGKRLVCEGQCPREHRPIACRIFPLRMKVVTENRGECHHVEAELDPRAWAVCPLLEEGGLRAMRSEFIHAVEQAGTLLCQNVYMLECLLNEQKMIDDMRRL